MARRNTRQEVADRSVSTVILKRHRAAYRCRHSEQTGPFYEEFFGLPLVESIAIEQIKTGRSTRLLHICYRMQDELHLAFLGVPDAPLDFKVQQDFAGGMCAHRHCSAKDFRPARSCERISV